jgi:hypothetical protein
MRQAHWEVVTAVGQDRSRLLKAEVNRLVGHVPERVEQEFSQGKYWTHRKERLDDPPDQEERQYLVEQEQPSGAFARGMSKLLGELGGILEKYGFPVGDSGVDVWGRNGKADAALGPMKCPNGRLLLRPWILAWVNRTSVNVADFRGPDSTNGLLDRLCIIRISRDCHPYLNYFWVFVPDATFTDLGRIQLRVVWCFGRGVWGVHGEHPGQPGQARKGKLKP